ncbi:Hypothetical protein A7982_08060 [Minicystis rosea]|nr:Hypothetical protein A7982_08060 [Minicystis rosea]
MMKATLFLFGAVGALTMMAAPACSSVETSPGGGSGGGAAGGGAAGGGGGGTPTDCMPALPALSPTCPDTPTAESAFTSLQSACGLTSSDLDGSNPQNPTLTATGKAKLCASCECQQKAFDYYALYANCTASIEAGNTALAKNTHDDAVACNE